MLMAKAETLRADGQTWAATAEQLGVCQSLLFRWRRESTGEAFKAVVVTPDTSVEAPSLGGTVSVATPDGFRITGLSVDDAVLLMEMLR